MGRPPNPGGDLTVTGPNAIGIGSGSSAATAQYTANKNNTVFSVTDNGSAVLDPGDYSVSINPSTGLLSITLNSPVPDGGALISLTVTGTRTSNGATDSLAVTVIVDEDAVPCFVAGTLIEMRSGPNLVEDIRPGDLVRTADGKLTMVRWRGERRLSPDDLLRMPHLRPVRISAGAFGPGRPARDLFVSPQHRIRLDGWRAEILFGEAQVLAHAIHLVDDCNVVQVSPTDGVQYVHFSCKRHEIVLSEGLATETLFPGDMALKALSRPDVAELEVIFPEIASPHAVSPSTKLRCLKSFEARLYNAN